MATKMTDRESDVRRENIYARPALWPWLLLAVAFVIALWFSAQHKAERVGEEPAPAVSPTVFRPGSGTVRGEPSPGVTPDPVPIPPQGASAP